MMRYSDALLHYFDHPEHAGELDGASGALYQAQVGNEQTGEVLALYLQIHSDRVNRVKYKVLGSPPLIAGAEFVCQWLENKNLQQVGALTHELILKELELPTVSFHVAALLCSAVQECIKGYHGRVK